MKKDTLNKILDFIFSKNNTKYLILLFIIGIILRLIFSFMIGGSPDETVYGVHALGIIESGLLQEMHEDPIWFYLTDLGYKIFGMTLVSSRLLSIIFGSLSILALYFLTKEMFGRKIALISSILLTFSAYHILMTLTEMDVAMTFFILLSSYFLVKYLKEGKIEHHVISTILLGIGILVKNIGALFIPAYIIALLLYPKIKHKEKIFSKKNIKIFLIFFVILFIIAIPTLTFNYLLYKEKGLTDLQFSRFLGGEDKGIYNSISNTIQPFSLNVLLNDFGGGFPGILKGLQFYWQYTIFLLIASIIGIFVAFGKNREYALYLLILFIVPFLFLSGTSLLEKHFVFAVPIFCIFSSLAIEKISNIAKKNSKYIIIGLILIFVILSGIKLYEHTKFSEKNVIQKTIEYKEKNIDKNSLVIVDSRVYTGRTAFIFNDRNYLETNYFIEFINQINGQVTGQKIKTYFIECIPDDCGWGTINSQPEFNKSTESIVSGFKSVSSLKTTIYQKGEPYFNVYETNIPYVQGMIEAVQSTHNHFFYPVGYTPKEKIILRYEANKPLHKLLDIIAHIILYIEIVIALFSIILLIKITVEEYKNETINNNSSV